MSTLHYEVLLNSDCALSQRAAGDEGAVFIPGSVVLGHVARAYDEALHLGLAWDVFHSGQVRFGDARLVVGGAPMVPVPLSLHFLKGQDWGDLASFQPADLAWTQASSAEPRQSLKDRQASRSGQILGVGTRTDMKTAVDFETQRAEESKLFRVHVVCAGQRFQGEVVITDEAPRKAELERFVAHHLFKSGRLGWSKRLEYGRVEIKSVAPSPPLPTQDEPGGVRLVLLSDTCLFDAAGQPTLVPTPAHFGLRSGRLAPEHTFLRWTRWTPFNAHRKRPDVERVALVAGSVVTFLGVAESAEQVRSAVRAGVGRFRAEGLGAVWVNPAPAWWTSASAVESPPKVPAVAQPAGPLADWLNAQVAHQRHREEAEEQRRDLAKRLQADGIKPAQWRRLGEVARWCERDPVKLEGMLFGDEGLCRKGIARQVWGDRDRSGTAANKLATVLGGGATPTLALALSLAAEDLARWARREKR